MATRRRIGVRLATTEAARRQLMQPVVCWEKVWVTQENTLNPSVKIYKWVKTDKKQQFSDDEEEADEPLAPLPDEPEVAEGDEDMEQDDAAPTVALDAAHDATDANFANQEAPEPQTKLSSPTSPVLSLQQTESILTVDEGADMLDASFKALDAGINVNVGVHENANQVGGLDMSVLGPDGTPYDSVDDLGQLSGANALLGGPLMDDAGDPFASTMAHSLSVQDQEPTG